MRPTVHHQVGLCLYVSMCPSMNLRRVIEEEQPLSSKTRRVLFELGIKAMASDVLRTVRQCFVESVVSIWSGRRD